jgi:tol-pal system protein YbgF
LLDNLLYIKYLNAGVNTNIKAIGDKMKKILFLIGSVAILSSITGCATRGQMIELQMRVDEIKADQATIKAQNAALDSLFRENVEQSRKLNADFSSYISDLNQNIQMMTSRLDDAVTLINKASGAMDSRRARGIPIDSTQIDTTKQAGGVDCQKLYNSAYADMVKERFDMAIGGFKNYIQTCPNTALDDKAQYWIGESYLSMKQYEKAQNAFEEMLQKYPNSDRIAAGKLKLGRALYELRQKTKARQYFEDVVKTYPGTDEAQEAAQMLERYR